MTRVILPAPERPDQRSSGERHPGFVYLHGNTIALIEVASLLQYLAIVAARHHHPEPRGSNDCQVFRSKRSGASRWAVLRALLDAGEFDEDDEEHLALARGFLERLMGT